MVGWGVSLEEQVCKDRHMEMSAQEWARQRSAAYSGTCIQLLRLTPQSGSPWATCHTPRSLSPALPVVYTRWSSSWSNPRGLGWGSLPAQGADCGALECQLKGARDEQGAAVCHWPLVRCTLSSCFASFPGMLSVLGRI